MAEYDSTNITELIEMIENQKLILPAMQRNFVWPEEKIYHLFDSLMRNYPIGTFLFWHIDNNLINQYAFNQFIKDVKDSKDNFQRGNVVTSTLSEHIAVLDGQQRITSIYVGVAGKWITHLKGKRWDDSSSFYNRFLCIDFMFCPTSDEEEYLFRFVKEDDIEKMIQDAEDSSINHYWVKVATIFGDYKKQFDEDTFDASDFADDVDKKNPGSILANPEIRKKHRKMLERLRYVLRKDKVISYFKSKDKPLSEVIDIFVRVNSGGQKLAASDLMLSVASGTLGNSDVHRKMQEAIDDINDSVKDTEHGFKVDKELILLAGLMFTGAKSLSLKKKENYDRNQMDSIFQSNWGNIINALSTTLQYIEYLGFNGKKLTSKNLILPVAYYFYINNLSDSHKDDMTKRAKRDRIFIRQWMLRSIINDVFMEGTGSTLVRIRDLIKDNNHIDYFPLDVLMKEKIKKPLNVSDEQIEEILNCTYGDAKITPLLMDLTCATIETYNEDHIWPQSLMLKKSSFKKNYSSAGEKEFEAYKEGCHKLANLQLLKPRENIDKSDTPFGEWIQQFHNDPNDDYFTNHLIPKGISYDFDNFIQFKERREELLRIKLKETFPDDFKQLIVRYNL